MLNPIIYKKAQLKNFKAKLFPVFLIFTFNLSGIQAKENTQKHILDSYAAEKKQQYLKSIQSMIKIQDQGFFYHLRLGWLFYLSKKYRNAIESYQTAIKLKPKSVTSYLGLFNAYQALGMYKDAEATLSSGYLKTKNPSIAYQIIPILIKKQKYSQAHKISSTMYEYFPEDPTILKYLVQINHYLKNKKQGQYYYQQIKIISPSSSFLLSQEFDPLDSKSRSIGSQYSN